LALCKLVTRFVVYGDYNERLVRFKDIGRELGFVLDTAGWTIALEQLLLFILILGKWLIPVENIPKAQLAQVLLIYIGLGADNMDFLEVLAEEKVRPNKNTAPVKKNWWVEIFVKIGQTKWRSHRDEIRTPFCGK